MSKYHPMPEKAKNKTKGSNMSIWAKVKCIFGFCAEKEEIEIREKLAIDATYKVQPLVVKVKDLPSSTIETVEKIKVQDEFGKAPSDSSETLEIKVSKVKKIAKAVKKTRAKQKATKAEKPAKVKRHWYTNGKTQKLVPEGEETSLPKTWKKGKLPKKD